MRPTSTTWILSIISVAATLAPAYGTASDPTGIDDFICQDAPYKVQLVSISPLVIYLKDFLTEKERAHLQAISKDSFLRSDTGVDTWSAARTSPSAHEAHDSVVQCIEERALAFQGFIAPQSHLEPLKMVHYTSGESSSYGTDWFADPMYRLAANGGNRVSSFFGYVFVHNDTKGGGINFPLVDAPRDERWCDVVDCDEPWGRGVTFRPIKGNAIYWQNLHPDGHGNRKTLHATLPITTGDQVGFNIRTRQAQLSGDQVVI